MKPPAHGKDLLESRALHPLLRKMIRGFLWAAAAAAAAVEPAALQPYYQTRIRCPCQYVGFSFPGGPGARADGAEIVGMNRMWLPVCDPAAPDGVGFRLPGTMTSRIEQIFRQRAPFTGLRLQFPTEFQNGSVRVELLGSGGPGRRERRIAQKTFRNVPDEYPATLSFSVQPPGEYRIRVRYVDGIIGVWTASAESDPAFLRYSEDGVAQNRRALEFAWRDGAGAWHWHSDPGRHRYRRLGRFPSHRAAAAAAGFHFMFWVGNWNNGSFPYYPDWFYEKFPDIVMRDARGRPIRAGILGKNKGWPSIDSSVIVNGTRRFVRAWVRSVRDDPNLVYWALGGETLYPTYLDPGVGWADYSDNAVAHFRAWLRRKYRRIETLNRAWGRQVADFADAEPPRKRTLSRRFRDWIDYRFAAMAERMAWLDAAVRREDAKHPALTCNHGNVFWGDAWAALGADFPQYADVSDGFEMGQIMEGDDPGCLNLWYAAALIGLGKLGCPARLAYRFPDPTARGGGTSYTPAAARRYCIEAFGAGWWHLGLIQYSGSLPDGEWGVKGTPAEGAIARVWRDLRRLRPRAEQSWPILPRIALYLSRTRWIQKGWAPAWTRFHVWAIQHQLDHAVLWEQRLLAGDAGAYPVVVSIDNSLVDPPAAQALAAYLDAGGHLIVIGRFAESDGDGKPFPPELRSRLVHHPRTRCFAAPVAAILARLPSILQIDRAGPFCQLVSLGAVQRRWSFEPEHGRHDYAWDAAPQRTAGQSFSLPADRIRRIAFRTPTFTKALHGFQIILELHGDGPRGPVLARKRIPAENVRDNAWTGMDLDLRTRPGRCLCLTLRPDRPIPPAHLGVWALRTPPKQNGTAWVDGVPRPWQFEIRVTCENRVPAATAVEAFTLFDGADFLVPLLNISDGEACVRARIDPAVVPAVPGGGHAWFDALDGARLDATASGVSVRIPPHGYRVVEFRARPAGGAVRHRLQRDAEQVAVLTRAGIVADYATFCLDGARRALARGFCGKALGRLNRLESSLFLRPVRCGFDSAGNFSVAVEAVDIHGHPVRGATGTARILPLPNVWLTLREGAAGRYQGRFSAAVFQRYDYRAKRYAAYAGPLQLFLTLRKGRRFGQSVHRLAGRRSRPRPGRRRGGEAPRAPTLHGAIFPGPAPVSPAGSPTPTPGGSGK